MLVRQFQDKTRKREREKVQLTYVGIRVVGSFVTGNATAGDFDGEADGGLLVNISISTLGKQSWPNSHRLTLLHR